MADARAFAQAAETSPDKRTDEQRRLMRIADEQRMTTVTNIDRRTREDIRRGLRK